LTKLQKKLRLDDAALKRIAAAVTNAESKTTGEIAITVTKESAHYSFFELIASVFFAAIVFCVLVPFAGSISAWFGKTFWAVPEWYVPAFYGFTCFGVIALGFYCANIPAIDRIVVPRGVRSICVTHRAFRCFTESGVYETKEHSGILIFISLLERQVRIVADSGISAKISQDLWNLIADSLAEGIGAGKAEEAITDAIQKCGDLLAQNFPAHEENPDELADGLVFLEDEEWF
jgi:putative membrane protein